MDRSQYPKWNLRPNFEDIFPFGSLALLQREANTNPFTLKRKIMDFIDMRLVLTAQNKAGSFTIPYKQ